MTPSSGTSLCLNGFGFPRLRHNAGMSLSATSFSSNKSKAALAVTFQDVSYAPYVCCTVPLSPCVAHYLAYDIYCSALSCKYGLVCVSFSGQSFDGVSVLCLDPLSVRYLLFLKSGCRTLADALG